MNRRSVAVAFVVTALVTASCSEDPQKAKRRFVESGDSFFAKKSYAEAIVEYRNAVARDGSFGEARFKLAEAYSKTGSLANALGEYIRAADLMPNDVLAQLRAGNGLLRAGQFPEAKERALKVLSKDPKNIDGLILMGYALAGMKDFDGAISNIEEAVDADPQKTMIYTNLGAIELAKGDRVAAEAALKRAVEVQPKSTEAHLSLANFYWAGNRPAEAEQEFKTALEIDPKSPNANRAFAVFYSSTGRMSESERYFKAYAGLTPDAGPKIILADFYLIEGKAKEAANVLEPLLQTKDGFIDAEARLATIHFAANRRQEAYQALDAIFKREPKNESALLEKARFLMLEQKPVEALAQANNAVAANPNSAGGHYMRGVALDATGAGDEAIKALQQSLQLSPSAVPVQIALARLLLNRGDAGAATEVLGQAIKNQPRSAIAHFLMAQSTLQLGDLKRAEAEATALAQTNPASADVATVLGDIYFAKRDLPNARAAYAKALQLQGGSINAVTGLVRVDLLENKPDAARSRIESQLAATPNNGALMLVAGQTFLALGDPKRAESMFRNALQADPSNLDAYGSLGALLKSAGRLDEARKEYEEASRRQPKAAVAATTMVGIILTLQQKPDEARKQYEKVLALDPQSPVAANNLAWDYAERGGASLDVALSLAQTAKARLPDNWATSDTLGWIYYKKGLASLAVTALRQGVEQAPTNPSVHYHLGLAYLKNGDEKEARKSLEQALKLDPKFSSADDVKRVLAGIKG